VAFSLSIISSPLPPAILFVVNCSSDMRQLTLVSPLRDITWTTVSLVLQNFALTVVTWSVHTIQWRRCLSSEWCGWAGYSDCDLYGSSHHAPCHSPLAWQVFHWSLALGHELSSVGVQQIAKTWGRSVTWRIVFWS
jgi:hypothetical protein